MDVGEAIRTARARLKLSATSVARAAGISRQQLCNIERSGAQPRPETLARLEEVLQTDLRDASDTARSQGPGYVLRLWNRLSPADREAMLDELVRRMVPDAGLADADEPLALAAR